MTNSEISYAQQLVGSAPDDSLTLFDRGFTSAELFTTWRGASSNTHWLTPIKAKMRYDIVESYTEHDHLIDMPVSPQAQKLAPYLDKKWQARLILIPTPTGEIKGFITSCLCPERYPFDTLVLSVLGALGNRAQLRRAQAVSVAEQASITKQEKSWRISGVMGNINQLQHRKAGNG